MAINSFSCWQADGIAPRSATLDLERQLGDTIEFGRLLSPSVMNQPYATVVALGVDLLMSDWVAPDRSKAAADLDAGFGYVVERLVELAAGSLLGGAAAPALAVWGGRAESLVREGIDEMVSFADEAVDSLTESVDDAWSGIGELFGGESEESPAAVESDGDSGVGP